MRISLIACGLSLIAFAAFANDYFKQREYDRNNNLSGQSVTHVDRGNHTTTTDFQDRNFNVIGHAKTDSTGRTTVYDKDWNVIRTYR